jgi:anaerobic selenocysteine-containing dehydrogenase
LARFLFVTRNAITDPWGTRTRYFADWVDRVDEQAIAEPQHWVQSACVLCSNGCALDIGIRNGAMVAIRGRAVDRVNRGRLGPKGLYGWQANASEDRLKQPLIRRDDKLCEATWDEAMSLIVHRTKEIQGDHTSSAIGFYNTGQLFLEEYWTLSTITDAGLRTPHVDGNTRLCTATASQALMQSFGTDGAPGSFTDFDTTDAIFHIGHNPATTQTVQWMRILDRRSGPNRPKLVVIDPRKTDTAKEADLHLAPRLGANLPLLNGLLHLMIKAGHIDNDFIAAHTIGFEKLEETVAAYPPERVSALTNVPANQLREAAEIVGTTPTLVSTVLQGVYQSMQSTAAAVQVNNIHLIRGLIGKPGCTVFQMNGQPSAQNARECGANGELVGFRNWNNKAHVADLARVWNVLPENLPVATPPTPAMKMIHLAEEGSLRMLWIICTNPAVSMPQLKRIRKILQKKSLFVVVQDAFMTETAELADVVLPAAIWGEKTGTLTNADRTVHISHKAIEPPGEARSDLEIFLDYAERMDFRDKDGERLIKWSNAEGAFESWKKSTQGRPCDYTALSYEKLSRGSGIQWPCNESNPQGRERLYTDGVFNTEAHYCEIYGHDLITGAEITEEQYRRNDPKGRAIIKAAEYVSPIEEPNEEYPFWFTTGRIIYHWHTRTKTGRVKELNDPAPDVFAQISEEDAAAHNISEGEVVEIESRRSKIRAVTRVGDIAPGCIFVPFHYGGEDASGVSRSANELTVTGWDPVSKQPYFKFAAVKIRKV